MMKYKKLGLLTLSIGSIFLTSVGHAADITASSDNPSVFFDDTSTNGTNNWLVGSSSNQFVINDYASDAFVFRAQPGSSLQSNNDSVVVEANGDMRLANTSIFINRTSKNIGIATETPEAKLDVKGDIKASFVGDSPKSLQQLFIMSANNTDSGRNSDAGFVLKNVRENFSYAFRTLENYTLPSTTIEMENAFAISKQGTGTQELVLVNPANDPKKVELHLSSGASNISGQWLNASSRSYKKNIQELSSKDAMQAMRGLKSVTYQFKQDVSNKKMIGFIAEDVPELLATKTRKTVDPLRIVAVLTKAVQEQDKALTSKDKKIAEMETRLNLLEKLIKQ